LRKPNLKTLSAICPDLLLVIGPERLIDFCVAERRDAD